MECDTLRDLVNKDLPDGHYADLKEAQNLVKSLISKEGNDYSGNIKKNLISAANDGKVKAVQ